jgi:DNA-binding LacI/PurR family transcriptional regulator
MFVVTDMLAAAAISALKSVGRVPPDGCAVVGYDNIEAWDEFLDPPLTSVVHAVREGGRRAAEVLVGVIEKTPIQPSKLPVTLVCRESCGCKTYSRSMSEDPATK